MPWMDWYNSLAKPTWTPAPSTIGLIWQILYPIILVSFGFVFVQAARKPGACPAGIRPRCAQSLSQKCLSGDFGFRPVGATANSPGRQPWDRETGTKTFSAVPTVRKKDAGFYRPGPRADALGYSLSPLRG